MPISDGSQSAPKSGPFLGLSSVSETWSDILKNTEHLVEFPGDLKCWLSGKGCEIPGMSIWSVSRIETCPPRMPDWEASRGIVDFDVPLRPQHDISVRQC